TARFALDAQLDAERNYARSLIYHLTVAARADAEAEVADTERLKTDIANLEQALASAPGLREILEEKRRKLADALAPKLGRLTWNSARKRIAQEREIESWIQRHWSHLPISDLKPIEIAELALLREFARRPKRQNSLETLGFIALEYNG